MCDDPTCFYLFRDLQFLLFNARRQKMGIVWSTHNMEDGSKIVFKLLPRINTWVQSMKKVQIRATKFPDACLFHSRDAI